MAGKNCLSEDDAAAYVTGELDADQRETFASHVDSCAHCHRLVSALAAGDVVAAGSPALHAGYGLGRFTLTRLLGRGSMGEVWAARDGDLEREIAIKLVRIRSDGVGSASMTRMRREAQAMARIHHPNVVMIHELGTDAHDRLFCAMELVTGVTLREWLATPRSWRAILGVASAVGRGVAAVHEAALVHRDIKPENVLIADDGRTLVSDFGLAKFADLGEPAGASGPDEAVQVTSLTATGSLLGTPIYMAPEHFAGGDVDARSDQFAYCVMVYEALFGARPFHGSSLAELRAASASAPSAPADPRGVPSAVVRCLVRGLATDPAARWPSMTTLVDQLERAARQPQRRRRWIAAAALLIGLAAIVLTRSHALDPVAVERDAAEARIATVWNPELAAVLTATFVGTGAPAALDRAAKVTRRLDAYRAAWIEQRLDAWSATHVRREQTVELLERRIACLDDLASSETALVGLLLAANRRDVDAAPQSASRLEPVATCGMPERLASPWFAPSLPVATKTAEVALRQLEALQIAGHHDEALHRASALLAEAHVPAVLARARYVLARLQANDGHFADADASLRLAASEAASVHDDHLNAQVWMRLYALTGFELGRQEAAAELELAARGAVMRAGNDPSQVAELEMAQGLVAGSRRDFAGARDHFRAALARRISARGASDPSVANDESNLSAMLLQLGELDEASVHATRAIEIIRTTLGEDNPAIARAESNLAGIALIRKDWTSAERSYRAALAIELVVHGAASPETGRLRALLGSALREKHDFAGARTELGLAREITVRALPPTHPDVILLDLYFAQLAHDEGQWLEAERLARRCAEALRAHDGAPRDLAMALALLADAISRRSPVDALEPYDQAVEQYVTALVRNPSDDDAMLVQGARIALAAKQPRRALAWFARLPAAAARLPDTRARLSR